MHGCLSHKVPYYRSCCYCSAPYYLRTVYIFCIYNMAPQYNIYNKRGKRRKVARFVNGNARQKLYTESFLADKLQRLSVFFFSHSIGHTNTDRPKKGLERKAPFCLPFPPPCMQTAEHVGRFEQREVPNGEKSRGPLSLACPNSMNILSDLLLINL